jgi:hypothetical protein
MKKLIVFACLATTISMTFGLNEAKGELSVQIGTPNLNFSISDYQPAPPNVYVQSDGGRPYYMERDRRVYMKKKAKHYKKEKKHYEDNGRKKGHYK